MPDEEELDCAPLKRKTITWTPNAFLSSLGHDTGFSTSEGLNNEEKVHQDWTSYHCQYLGLMPIPGVDANTSTWGRLSRTSPSSK